MSRVKTLREHLGPGERAAGFEEWTAEISAAAKTAELIGDPWRAMFGRMLETVAIAGTETLRREEKLGTDYAQACFALVQAMGYCAITAALSGMKDDVPAEVIDRMAIDFARTFKEAAVQAAKNCAQQDNSAKEQVPVIEDPLTSGERAEETKERAEAFYNIVRTQIGATSPGVSQHARNEGAFGAAIVTLIEAAQRVDATVRPFHGIASGLVMCSGGSYADTKDAMNRAFDDMAEAAGEVFREHQPMSRSSLFAQQVADAQSFLNHAELSGFIILARIGTDLDGRVAIDVDSAPQWKEALDGVIEGVEAIGRGEGQRMI